MIESMMIWRQQTGAPGHLRPAQCKKKKKKRKVTVASTMIASWSPGPLRHRMTPRGLGVGQLQPRAAQTTRERVPVPVAREGTARWLTRPARRRHASGAGGTPHNCPKTHGPITSGVPCIPIRIHTTAPFRTVALQRSGRVPVRTLVWIDVRSPSRSYS